MNWTENPISEFKLYWRMFVSKTQKFRKNIRDKADEATLRKILDEGRDTHGKSSETLAKVKELDRIITSSSNLLRSLTEDFLAFRSC